MNSRIYSKLHTGACDSAKPTASRGPWVAFKGVPQRRCRSHTSCFYANLPGDYEAFGAFLCFWISSDYKARTFFFFSFSQQSVSCRLSVAAAAGSSDIPSTSV